MRFRFREPTYDNTPTVQTVVWTIRDEYDLARRQHHRPDGLYSVDRGKPDYSLHGWQVHYCLDIVKGFIRLHDENKV